LLYLSQYDNENQLWASYSQVVITYSNSYYKIKIIINILFTI